MLCGIAQIAVAGALQWEKTAIPISCSLDQTEAIAYFPFKNTGHSNITINDMQTSCGCTIPSLEKRDYGPGEAGTIKVVFKFGDYLGLQEKTVRVFSSESPNLPTTLSLSVTIPKTFTVEPRALFWKLNDPAGASPKEVSVASIVDRPIEITSVEVGNPNFVVTTISSKPAEKFTLSVTPLALTKPVRSFLRIKFQSPPNVVRERMVLLIIQ